MESLSLVEMLKRTKNEIVTNIEKQNKLIEQSENDEKNLNENFWNK